MDKQSTLLLTGAAGFIGSCVLRALNEKGYKQIVVVDDLGKTDQWKNLVGKQFSEILHKDHLFDWLEAKERNVQAIIHLGACSSTIETDTNFLLENNYRYSVNLATYAFQRDIRFIYASSAATYGNGAQGFSDRHEDLEYLQPLNMYGYSKHLFDLWLKNHGYLDKVVGLKYFNVFGPNEYHKGEMASSVFRMFPEASSAGTIRLFQSIDPQNYGDGEQVRDFIYVLDAARMTVQFLHNDFTGIVNIGMGKAHTWNAVAEGLGLALEKKLHIQYIPTPQYLIGKYQNYTCADMSKTIQQGLMLPQFTLKEAIINYVQNHLLTSTYL